MVPQQLLRMPASVYHQDPWPEPSLSSSIAHTLVSKSPRHAWAQHPRLGGKPRVTTGEMDTGTLVHAILLNTREDIVVVEAADFRSKAAREARDEARELGKVPVLPHDLDEAERIADAVRTELWSQLHLELNGESELTALWTETDGDENEIRCRGRLDHLIRQRGLIVDLKTSRSSHPRACTSHMVHYGYDIQSTAYTSAIESIIPELIGRVEFLFLFCEVTEPYCVTAVECAGSMQELGAARWSRAKNLWSECLRSGHWPGYASNVVRIEAPAWALNEEMDHGDASF